MNLPMRSISFPRFIWKSGRVRKVRGLPKFLITPLSISLMKWGSMEVKDGMVYQNIELKTVTVLDILRWMKMALLVLGIALFVLAISYSLILVMGSI